VFFLNQYSQIGKVAPNGTVSLVPGFDSVPSPDTCLDDSPIQSIAADSAGNLYVIESSRILRVSADGKIENIAGNDNFLLGDGGPATSAVLTYPWGVAIGPQGAVYFTDAFNWSVRKVDATGTITTIAGNGHPTSRCGVPTPENPIVTPMQIAVDPAGSLFVASTQNRVVKFDVDGIRNVVAGDGYTGPPGTVEAPLTTTLKDPHGVAVDSRGNLYIADTFESRIQVMSPDGVVRTLTGTGEQGDSGDGGDPFVAKLYAPTSIALDAAGNLYFADTGNQRIRKVALGGIITTVAGSNSAKNSRRWRPRHSSAIMLSARCRRRCGWQSLYQRYLLRPDSQGHPERHHLHHRPR
jgi:DNA-binding beta-propeller fold protein YncE